MATRLKAAPTAASRAASKASAATRALYLYGVSRAARKAAAMAGIDMVSPVETAPCGKLVCWFSRVDRAEYAERLEQNMENLDWLAAASVQHQRVVGAIAGHVDILPARFGTVFLSEENLVADVESRQASVKAALDRIAGCDEWGVKIFVEPPSAPATPPATSGREYLLKKRAAMQQQTRVAAPAELADMEAELRRVASAAVVGAARQPVPRLVWQASFLVARSRTRSFIAVLQRYARAMPDARIETTGPWPAYSFVNPPGGASASNQGSRAARRGPRKSTGKRKP